MATEDLTGRTFGQLTVLGRVPYYLGGPTWDCLCSCGNHTDATSYQLTHHKKISCGCYRRQAAKG